MSKKSTISHFPVGNGDMTLLKIASNDKYHYVLVDMHICKDSKEEDDKCDVLKVLHDILEEDGEGRPYIDALLLTHPDEDHIRGFKENFHCGKPDAYSASDGDKLGKIFVREIWSSPLIFRRKSKNHNLCEDAIAFNTEAKRRVNLYKKNKIIGEEGNRVRLFGKDENGKTDEIMDIVYQNEDCIDTINEIHLKELSAVVLGPLPDDEFEDSSVPDKNRSSVIIQWGLAGHGYEEPTNYIMLAGDAGVEVWDLMWEKYENDLNKLQYDILLAPHHCSWHTLSRDSFSQDDDPQVSDDTISALSQARQGVVIISSSDEIKDDDRDPPNYKAMKEYEKIVDNVDGDFTCLSDNKPSKDKSPEVLIFKLTRNGPQVEKRDKSSTSSNSNRVRTAATSSLFIETGDAIAHG